MDLNSACTRPLTLRNFLQANELAEKKRIKEQAQALKKEEKKKKGKGTGDVELGGKALEEVEDDDLKNIDKDALIKAKKAQEEKLKRDAEERMNLAVQKLDHLAKILKSELYRDCTASGQPGSNDILRIFVFSSGRSVRGVRMSGICLTRGTRSRRSRTWRAGRCRASRTWRTTPKNTRRMWRRRSA